MNVLDCLQIDIVPTEQISVELDKRIDQLDRLASNSDSANKDPDPEFDSIDWSSPIEYMALGYIDDELVTLLGLLKREILVGGTPVLVAGVGGVATHPNWQRRGFSSALLQTVEKFLRKNMAARYGLLVCADGRRSFYGRVGWQHVANELFFIQNGQCRTLKTSVMILPLTEQAWLAGEINLCGLPW